MLRALLHNKLGRVLSESNDETEVDGEVRDRARRSEDALTAVVFSRLTYLRPELAEALVRPALHGSARPFGGTTPTAHFWPSHRLAAERVEPDVVLEHPDRVVVVEVKWDMPHYREQWIRELGAARSAFPGRPLELLLVGRRRQQRDVLGKLTTRPVEAPSAWVSWEDLFDAVEGFAGAMEPWERAVHTDILASLAERGLRRRSWLGDLERSAIATTPKALLTAWRP